MPAKWLNVVLSRRYSVTAMGDPMPTGPALKAGPEPGPNCEPDCEQNKGPNQTQQPTAPGPFLILPNYPALINIPLVYAQCAALRPLVLVTKAQNSALKLFCDADRVILPDCAESADKIEQDGQGDPSQALTEALNQAADALAAGRSVLLWPCSLLQGHDVQGVPEHNPAFALLTLLQERGQALPELFLLRSEGLWGSHFSRYHSADCIPSFWGTLCAQLPTLLLGPFLKRRPVRLVSRRHSLRPRHLNPQGFRAMLNTWFDAGHDGAVLVGHLPLTRIRRMPLEYTFTPAPTITTAQNAAPADSTQDTAPPNSPTLPASSTPPTPSDAPAQQQPPHSTTSAFSPLEPQSADTTVSTTATPHSAPASDSQASLPVDPESASLPDHQANDVAEAKTLQNADSLNDESQAPKPPIDAPIADIIPAVPRTPPLLPVQHALTRQGSVTDASYGQHFSRRGLLGLAKAIGTLIGPVPATRIGISLPCGVGSMAAYIAVLDCTLENDRTPVLLDPDLSPDQLAHCAAETGITHVITSRKLQGRGLPPEASPIYLDDITTSQIMRGTALSFMGFAGTTEMDAPAAIFCQAPPLSSADSTPVPLLMSHQELMTRLHTFIAQLSAPPLHVHSLSILGCLPQCTPLGLLTNTILPLTCGVPIVTVYSAQDGLALARSAENYSVNCFTGTALSLKNLFRHARSQLAFRYIMLPQNDPCPDELLSLIPKACPHAQVFFR